MGDSPTTPPLKRRGRRFDCDWYADTERLLDEAGPDVLIVCTPSGAHLEPTLAAAERGIDVVREKPLEITTERIDEMIAAADEAGIALDGEEPYPADAAESRKAVEIIEALYESAEKNEPVSPS